MPELLDYLQTRRSTVSVALEEPGPDEATLRAIVTLASRVPDHGKLAPWRFEAWSPRVRQRMHAALAAIVEPGEGAAKELAGLDKLLHAPTVLAVISTASDHVKIPKWEQELSAGAACYGTLIAANAHGFEAQWLTAWYVYRNDARATLGLRDGERIAGMIHIGSSTTAKPDRDRPDLDAIFSLRT